MYSWGIFLVGNRELSVQIEHWQEFSNNSAKNFVENSKREAIVSSLKKGLAYIKKTAYLENLSYFHHKRLFLNTNIKSNFFFSLITTKCVKQQSWVRIRHRTHLTPLSELNIFSSSYFFSPTFFFFWNRFFSILSSVN